MKTIEQILVEECKNFASPLTPEGLIILVECVTRKYTEEAIKLDRINLLEHVICYETNELDFNSAEDENGNLSNLWSIDRESLLNAPNIELL